MQLTRLEIKGFKSFGDKIIINFNEGVTAIVGPNGCGKSNVVDAIRWVLGEQSTRMLRSEKMDNVIFNGTKSRKPANLAEVSLTFDNTKNILPTDFSQITVTRRLYRTGESEYLLNDVLCRLKDITDLFLDTGIGADSYSIIELKMIDEIITNKEGSRRNLFEEASGISKYKLRKKQTFNKLKDTEADLERVEDLLFEIEKNLKTLENQAKKTERYYRLKEQYKSYSLVLASFRIAAFGSSLTHIEDQEQKHQVEKTGIVALIGQLEAVVQQQKLDSLTSEKNLSAQQKATNEFVANIRAYESEQKLKNEQLKFQQDRETRIMQELDKDGDQLKLLVYNIQRLTDEKELEDKNLQVVKEQLSGLKQEVDESRLKQLNARDDLNQVANAKNVLQNQVYQIEKNLDIFQIQQKALEQEGQRNLEDKTSKEAELSQFTEVITGLKSRLQDVEEDYRGLISFDNKLKEDIASSDADLSSAQEIIIKESRKLDALQNEYNLTKSMVDNLDGFPESIRFLSKSSVWTGNVPLFSDILFCREEYRIAIENYLEPLMNYYIVNTYDDAIKGINLLSSSAQGRAQFFVLENYEAPPNPIAIGSSPEGRTLENGSLEAPPFGERLDRAVPALEVIQVDPRYQELCSHLLKNVYIVDDKDGREFNNDQLSDKIVLVGKSGKFNKTRYTMAGGSVGLFDGKRIGRAKNLETLSKSITVAEEELAGLKGRFDALRGKLSSLKSTVKTTELKQNQLQINQLNNELITVNTRREQYEAFIGNSETRKEDIAAKIDKIKAEQGALRPQLEDLKKKSELQNDIVTTKQKVFNELNEQVTLQSNAYNQENIRFHQQLNKVSGLLKDLDYRQGQREQLDDRLKQNNAELENVKIAIRENLIHAGSSDTSLLEMYAQKEELEKGTQHAEQDYYEWRGKIAATENEITALRRKKDNADFIENEIKDRRNNLKLELNALKERLSVEFNVDIHDLPENDVVAGESEKEVREKTEKLKKQLDDFGSINPLAVEAYQEMNERYTFIQAQKKDLADAKASLLATIQEIDGTAKEKFLSSFVAVRENFIRVFRSLFNEEDSCDLLLTDPLFPLESDIDIIAKPKGKRPLSINQLSGGEKTLTATAILFSLYLLKPAPFCIFDEVDAPLDDTNIDKFNHIIREFSKDSQFIIISHNKRTIASTDIIYGVTMVEQGISRVVPVDLRELVN